MTFMQSPAVSGSGSAARRTFLAQHLQTFDLPHAMQQAPRWGLWRFENRDGKSTKVPYSVRSGRRADVTNPADWTNFQDAVGKLQAGSFEGLGFALGPDGTGNYWQGIDLDHVVANGLQELAHKLPGYVEVSPSGDGVHAIGYGAPFSPFKRAGIEAYCEKRFFTVTGRVIRSSL